MMILFIQCNIAIRAMSWNKNKSSYGGLHCNSNDRFVESEYYFFIIIQFNLFIQKKTTSINILISKEKDICEFRANHMFNL